MADHPIDDSNLPSYHHPILRDLQEDLTRAYDTYNCLRGCKDRYLPQEEQEPPESYKARLERSVFSDFYRASIHAFSGILSKFSLDDPPPTLETFQDNIDLEGNSLVAWFMHVDTCMLRDGGIALQVEMPSALPSNAAQETILGRRPYLVYRTRSRVLNWRTSSNNGIEELEQVTFLEYIEEEDGAFGIKLSPRYKVITRGEWYLIRIDSNENNDLQPTVEDYGEYIGANGTKLNIVPVIWYSTEQSGFGHGELPLRQVVEHSLEHFQQRSDLREKTHKCAMPVPVIIGQVPPPPGQPRKKTVIGPNSVIELQEGGSFTFAEPSATSLIEQRAQIDEVTKLISRQTLGFLYGDSGPYKNITRTSLEGSHTESTILRIAQRKSSAMQSLMQIWCLFTGEPLDSSAGLRMSSSIYEKPMEASDVDQLHKLTGNVELVSRRSAIEELQRSGRLKVTTSVDEEIKRIDEQKPRIDEGNSEPVIEEELVV